tara:strand:+ start:795 stop:4148 length:3354 start_codon:yes stop_codon:yes gene_type:complete
MTKRLFHIFLWVLLFIFSQQNLFASHGAGLDISYECVSQGINSNNYKITVKYYRDCSSSSTAAGSFDLDYTSSCGSSTLSLPQISGPTFITPLCSALPTICNNGFVELEEYIYQTTISLIHCNDWILTVCANGNRNSAITTIQNPTLENLCVKAEIDNLSICNNSPSFTEYPAPYICAGQSYCYNNGAVDIDGDSLVYSLEAPNTGSGGVTYLGAFSALNPISGTTNFDPLTGNLCMNATQNQVSVIAMKITEYRNGFKIGSVLRDIQIIVLNCPIPPPVLSGFNGSPQNVTNAIGIQDSLSFCANNLNNINFSINSNLGLSNNKIMSWSGINGIPSASFVITNNNSNTPTGTFNWTPQLSDVINSPFTFTVNVEDDACPINNQFSYTYTITLSSNASFNITYNQINFPSCIGYNDGNINLTVTGTTGLTTYDWTGPNNFTSTNEDINTLFSGTYNITITDAAGCIMDDNINIIDPADLNITPVISSVSCVGANNGGIDITVTPNSGSLLYSWTGPNNFTSTNDDITSLSAGTYDLVITDASSGCFFNEVMIVPTSNPFNTNIFVDSISCMGYNDGAINLTLNTNSSLLTFSWTGPNNFTSSNEDINSLLPGTYNITITDTAGCMVANSIILYDPANITSLTAYLACDSYFWNNIMYSNSGIYTNTTIAANGCDSTAILNLTIYNSSNSTTYVQSCNDYNWNGNVYTVSGTYPFEALNSAGCDSIAYLVLTISNFSTSTTLVKDCNPYLWNGVTYEYSGIYTDTSTNVFGCDSIATLDLNITSYAIDAVSPICINDSSIISINITDPSNNNHTITINDFSTSSIYKVDSSGNLLSQGIPIKFSPEKKTQFILTSVIDENNCQTFPNDTIIIRVNPLPIIDLFLDDICVNEPPFLLNNATPMGGIYFVDNKPTDLFNASNIGVGEHILGYNYIDSITNCIAKKNDVVRINPKPYAEFYCDYYITKQDTPITFFNTSTDYVNLYWELDNGSFFQDSISFSYGYENIGIYNVQLIAVNEYNCSDTVINDISVISSYIINIPSAFTPNGDDHNEMFFPVGEGIISYNIKIYNRWGERVFDGANNTPWLGEKCSDGAYTFVIDVINLKDKYYQYIGDIFLIK